MFENFLSKFKVDTSNEEVQISPFDFSIRATGLERFLKSYSGCSFNSGLYRIHLIQNIKRWNRIVSKGFPEFSERIFCFGYDWLGRQMALDSGRLKAGEPLILLLEPGTGEALEIPVNFLQFHEYELVNYSDEALAQDFYKAWLFAENNPPSYKQCISYKKPLFLGGADILENLEIMDLEVYWDISGQLLEKVRGLPPGTPINNITIE